jgi:peptide/nickel transport system substrate-binding protein
MIDGAGAATASWMRNRVGPRVMRIRHLVALLLMVSALGLRPAAAKDSLVIGVAQFPASLHPFISSQTVQFYVIGFALRPMTAIDAAGHNVCLLCTELPTLQNGLAKLEDRPDGSKGMAVTFKLKPGLTWGDGVPVTAKDIAFTWKLGRDPNAGFVNNHPWNRASAVDVVDDQTAILHLDSTLVSYNEWDQILPEHIEGPIYAKATNPGDYINHTAYNSTPLLPGLWNGPYVISGYQSGAQIEMTPNPHWPGPPPALKRITIRLVEDTAALQANLLSGDVDLTPAGIGLTIDQVAAMKTQYPDRFQYIFKPSLTYEHIDMQRSNPILADPRVRQALLLAIDRKTLVQKLFGGYALEAKSWIDQIEPNYDDVLPTIAYDPAKARALLADAGWKPGPDGILRNDKGDRFSLEISTTSGNRVRELSEQVLQSQWKSVGVDITIHNQPSRSFFGEYMRKLEYTGLAEYAYTSQPGLVPSLLFASSSIPTTANNWSGLNWISMNSPQMDADLQKAATELDPVKARALWDDMQRIYAAQDLVLPLYFRSDPDIVPTWLKGYEASGKEDYTSYWAEDWHP